MREFSIFHLSKPEWDASKIGVKSNGGWSVFTDPITHKSLNSPRHPYPEPKIIYRRKTEEQLEQEEKARKWREIRTKKKGNNFNNFSTVTNPLLNPPKDNYKEFRARKQLTSSKNSNSDFDDFEISSKDILTSRSTPRKPQKTVQLARDLQITSLNTQRNPLYSHSTARGCTPRSRGTSIRYNSSDENICNEEESVYENDLKLQQNIISDNEEDIFQSKNDIKTEIADMKKTETEIILLDTNDSQNFSENSIKKTNNNAFDDEDQSISINDSLNQISDENKLENRIDTGIIINDTENKNENEINKQDSTDNLIERIEIKTDLTNDIEIDSMNSEIHTEIEFSDQNKGETNIQNQEKDEIQLDSKNTKQWKSKRTGKVISGKPTIIKQYSTPDNQNNRNLNLDSTQNKTNNVIIQSSDHKEFQSNKFNHNHPNDKPIHYNFRYNHPNNLKKSDKKNIHDKRNTYNNKIKQKMTYTINKSTEEINNKQNIVSNKEVIKIINKNATNDNTSKIINNNLDIKDENDIHNNISENEGNIGDKKNAQNYNYNNHPVDDDRKNNEPIQSIQNSIIIHNDNDENDSKNASIKNVSENNDNDSNDQITNQDSIINNNNDDHQEYYEFTSLEDDNNNNGNLSDYQSDSYEDYNEQYSISAESKTKKVSNIYGYNYNDYNYYSNVIRNNTKVNLAASAPFEFAGTTRIGRMSGLGAGISHDLSPLPTTRRPATAIRQKFIERPECIGPERFFKGDDPAPARRFFQSANLVAEMRREEELKMLKNAGVKRNLSKTVTRKGPSLYERSLKPKEKRYCWPRDFAHFSVE